MTNKCPLEKAIAAAEADAYGGKVIISIEDAKLIYERLNKLDNPTRDEVKIK